MRKTKKQLLGLAGLGVVGIMTAIAYGMPTPDAAATEGYVQGTAYVTDSNAAANGGSDVDLQVVIGYGTTAASTTSPKNGSVVTNPELTITTNFSETLRLDYYIVRKAPNGTTYRTDLPSHTPSEAMGTYSRTVNLTALGVEYGDTVTLHTRAEGPNGTIFEDSVEFSYAAISSSAGDTADNGDPGLAVEVGESVKDLVVQVYDKDGNPLFVDEEGEDTPIVIDPSKVDGNGNIKVTLPNGSVANGHLDANGKFTITLPFEELKVPAGEYTITILGRDDRQNVLTMDRVVVKYAPTAPEVPNTGALLFGDLNISRLDYLLTGLIAFGLVAGFAMFLICRRNRRA